MSLIAMAVHKQRLVVGCSLSEQPIVIGWNIDQKGRISAEPVYKAKLGSVDYHGSDIGLQLVNRLQEMKAGLQRDGFKPDAFGVAVPGTIDRTGGRVLSIARMQMIDKVNQATNVRPKPIELRHALRPCKCVVIENDVTSAALGEYFEGGYRGKTLAYLYVDRGINAAIVKNGYAWRGRINSELGHFSPRFDSVGVAEGQRRKSIFQIVDKVGFCQLHDKCFEKLLARQVIEQYAPKLLMLDVGGDKDIQVSNYQSEFVAELLSQMCEIVSLGFGPDLIAIAGYPSPSLINQVRTIFEGRLQGYALPADTSHYIRRSEHDPDRMAAYGAAVEALTELTDAQAE